MERHKAKGRTVETWADLCAQVTFKPFDAYPFWKRQKREFRNLLLLARDPESYMDFHEPRAAQRKDPFSSFRVFLIYNISLEKFLFKFKSLSATYSESG